MRDLGLTTATNTQLGCDEFYALLSGRAFFADRETVAVAPLQRAIRSAHLAATANAKATS